MPSMPSAPPSAAAPPAGAPAADGNTTWFDIVLAAGLAAFVAFLIARVRYGKKSE